jgi:Fe-S cluster assembly protein SufD
MTETVETKLSRYAELAKGIEGSLPRAERERMLARFLELGFPTPRLEDWKYTNAAPIASTAWALPVAGGEVADGAEALGMAGDRLVFVDGIFEPARSRVSALADGVVLTNLRNANGPAHLNRHVDSGNQAFVALNGAFASDGAYLRLPDGAVLERPVNLIFLSSGSGEGSMSSPRTLIVAGRNTEAQILEVYAGTRGSRYFTNAVTEIVAGPNSIIDHYKLQNESEAAYHVATIQIQHDRDSRVSSTSIALGAALSRTDMNVTLGGEGSGSTLNGLYLARGEQHVDHHTLVDHAQPHCDSRQLFKGVLDGHSRGVFDGKIIVRKDAQKTNSGQVNNNLLLSPNALIDTKPQLEIYADDVKCTHGSTVGQIDEDALFYLRSRAIGLEDARHLMIFAFAGEVVQTIRHEGLRAQMDALLLERLPGFRRPEDRT